MIRFPPLVRLLAVVALAGPLLGPGVARGQGHRAVHSKNGTDVWAVGDGGAWARSFDGGISWSNGQLTTARTLRGIAHRGLIVIAVADSGQIFRSTDNGVSWTRTVLPGTPDLKAVEMPGPAVAVLAGAGETILRSVDGGATWTPQGPGGAATLHGLRMTSDLEGWAVGSGGRVLHSVDGATWSPVAVPTPLDLFAVDAAGARVWIVGSQGLALRSSTGGGSWTPLDLGMEVAGDVRAVTLSGAAGVLLTGGGGFIRRSSDDGATWTFATHPLIAATADHFAYDASRAWVTAAASKAIVRTTDGGTTWALPAGTTTGWNWQLKRAAGNVTVRGNTFATIPQNRNAMWCVMGPAVHKSLDRGETWTQVATIPVVVKTNSFYVSPVDSNVWVAACGPPDQIARTTDAGVNWTTTLSRDFTEYGMPLEMNPDRPDTLLFGPEDGRVYRSQDFGATWDTLSSPGFRSPCDIVISPGNDTNVLVGDGVTGIGLAKIFQSPDGGVAWIDRYTGTSSETPTLWSSRLGANVVFATNWSSGGVWRSTNWGQNWSQVTTVTSAWGGATSADDPKLVVYNRYAGSPNYVSTDGGTTFSSSTLLNPGSGYALATFDRSTILDLHSAGIFKLAVTYTVPPPAAASVTVVAPNGGETWAGGSVHAITWTAVNLPLVAIDWRAGPADPWLPVAQVEGSAGSHAWTVPHVPTSQAQVRIRDAADGTPADESNAVFTIVSPRLVVTPLALDFGARPVGSSTLDSVRVENTGNAPLTVSSIGTETSAFVPGRTSLALAAGASDSLGVTFSPAGPGAHEDTLVLVHDAGEPARVPLSGSGQAFEGLVLTAPDGGEVWQYGEEREITWLSGGVTAVAIDWRSGEASPWTELAAGVAAGDGAWTWTIPAAPTTTARVRVREVGGGLSDVSAGLFSVVVPGFLAAPAVKDFGPVPIGYSTWDTLHVENPGTAPLTVSAVTSDDPNFRIPRTSFVVAPGEFDTLAVWFLPGGAGADSAWLTFTADDPVGTHGLRLRGTGQPQVGAGSRPLAFALEAPRPNPFAEATTVRFALPEASEVSLEVFDLGGRRVAVLARGRLPEGLHSVVFRPAAGDGLSSGVYFVRLRAGTFERTRKILHLAP